MKDVFINKMIFEMAKAVTLEGTGHPDLRAVRISVTEYPDFARFTLLVMKQGREAKYERDFPNTLMNMLPEEHLERVVMTTAVMMVAGLEKLSG